VTARHRPAPAVCSFDDEPFVEELSVVQDIVAFCEMSRATRQLAIVWGENQSGKSRALSHYAATRADTVLVRLPAGGSTGKSMAALARACGVAHRRSDDLLRERILERFTPASLLIVDEFHQAVNGRTIRTVTVDRLREIHDLCGCGVVLCGTHVVAEMIEDARFQRFLGQVDNRGALRLNIPKAPTRRDRERLAAAYELPAPERETAKLVKEICDRNGIARLTDYFKIARRLAIKGGQPLTWSHFNLTHTTLKAWAAGIRKED
jgi:DNA transposition AAA+ family ATPase